MTSTSKMQVYLQRCIERFPEVLDQLGDASVPELFYLPSEGGSITQVEQDAFGNKVVRIVLQRRDPRSFAAAEAESWREAPTRSASSTQPAWTEKLQDNRQRDQERRDDDAMWARDRDHLVEPASPRSPGNFKAWPTPVRHAGQAGRSTKSVQRVASNESCSSTPSFDLHDARVFRSLALKEFPKDPKDSKDQALSSSPEPLELSKAVSPLNTVEENPPIAAPQGEDADTKPPEEQKPELPLQQVGRSLQESKRPPPLWSSQKMGQTAARVPKSGSPKQAALTDSQLPVIREAAAGGSGSPASISGRSRGSSKDESAEDSDSSLSSGNEIPFVSIPRGHSSSIGELPDMRSSSKSNMPSSPMRIFASPGALSMRRGLSLTLAADSPEGQGKQVKEEEEKDKPLRARPSFGLAGYASPENKQPAVQLLFRGKGTPSSKRSSTSSSQPGTNPSTPVAGTVAPNMGRRRSFTVAVFPVLSVIPRPLPAAFPNHRNIIFFDWDDTLCPTTWIRSVLKETLADMEEWAQIDSTGSSRAPDWRHEIPGWFSQPLPDEPSINQIISEVQEAIINVINVAQAFGAVCIVTNAVSGWVEKTIKRWLPQVKQYIAGHGARPPIKVLYGQQAYVAPPASLENLDFLDELGPHMWWKKAAMAAALDEVGQLYRLGADEESGSEEPTLRPISWCSCANSKRIASVISIGDNEAEIQAVEIASMAYDESRSAPRRGRQYVPNEASAHRGGGGRRHSVDVLKASRWPWVKRLKLRECLPARQLIAQLAEIAELLPVMVATRQHLSLDLEQLGPPRGQQPDGFGVMSAASAVSSLLRSPLAELQAEQALMVQTV